MNEFITLFLIFVSISGILLIPFVIVLKYKPEPPTIIGIFPLVKQFLTLFFTLLSQSPAEKYFFTETMPYK